MFRRVIIIPLLAISQCAVFSQTLHTIQRGETFELIARRYGITTEALMAANPDEEGCFVGMQLKIPAGEARGGKRGVVTRQTLAHLEQAAAYLKAGKNKKATSVYAKIIKASPSSTAYLGRGLSYYNRNKYKSAIKDFEAAMKSSDCSEEMRERCQDLVASAEKLRAEQHERRGSFWGELASVFVGAAAATASAAMASSNNGYTAGVPSNMNGFQRNTSMDYLLAPRYAMMQVQQEEMAEYQQFKRLTGQDITLEQYRMLKYSSAQETTGSDVIDDNPDDTYKGELSPSQYEAAYRRWEHLAESQFNSVTLGGVKGKDRQGNIRGKVDSDTKGWAYTGLSANLRKAQNEMRKIRLEAEKYGVHITPSKWETATASY